MKDLVNIMLNQIKNFRKMYLSISQTRLQRSRTVSLRFLDKSFLLSPAEVNTEYRTKELAAHYIVDLPCLIDTECQIKTGTNVSVASSLAVVKFEDDLFHLEVAAEWIKEELAHVSVSMQGQQQFIAIINLERFCAISGIGHFVKNSQSLAGLGV